MRRHGVLAALGLALASLYLLSIGRGFYSSDGEVMFLTTASLVERGTLALDPEAGLPQIVRGAGGRFVSKYDPGFSLLAVPFYMAGDRLAAINRADRYRLAAVFTLAMTALAAAGSVMLAGTLGAALGREDRGAGAVVALSAGLGTPLWFYGRVLFPEAALALAMTGAVWVAWRGGRGSRAAAWSFLSGMALGVGVLTRLAMIIYAVPLAWLVFRTGRKVSVAGRVWRMAWFALGLAPALAGIAVHNLWRFGDVFRTGYGGESFSASPWVGVAGLLISPGKGALVFAPVLVLAACLWPRFRRVDAALAESVLLAWIVAVPFYGAWWAWDGGWCWGPRFLVPLMPLSCLPLVTLPRRRAWWAALVIGVLVGGVINALGIMTDEVAHIAAVAARSGDPTRRIAFTVTDGPFVGALRALGAGRTEPLGLFHLADLGLPLAWSVGVPVGLLAGLLGGGFVALRGLWSWSVEAALYDVSRIER